MTSKATNAPVIADCSSATETEPHPRPPSIKMARGRRRPDPLASVWDAEILPMLEAASAMRAVAVFDEIRRCHPEISQGVAYHSKVGSDVPRIL